MSYLVFYCCDKHHAQKNPGQGRVYFISQVIFFVKGVMAGTPGRKLGIETEAEAMAEWCLLACSQACSVCFLCSPGHLPVGGTAAVFEALPTLVKKMLYTFAYRKSDQRIFLN